MAERKLVRMEEHPAYLGTARVSFFVFLSNSCITFQGINVVRPDGSRARWSLHFDGGNPGVIGRYDEVLEMGVADWEFLLKVLNEDVRTDRSWLFAHTDKFDEVIWNGQHFQLNPTHAQITRACSIASNFGRREFQEKAAFKAAKLQVAEERLDKVYRHMILVR